MNTFAFPLCILALLLCTVNCRKDMSKRVRRERHEPSKDAGFIGTAGKTVYDTAKRSDIPLKEGFKKPSIIVSSQGRSKSPHFYGTSKSSARSFAIDRFEFKGASKTPEESETLSYLAVEEGDFYFKDGGRIAAGSSFAGGPGYLMLVAFPSAFEVPPIVLVSISDGKEPLVPRVFDVTQTHFKIYFQHYKAEDERFILNTNFCWIAFSRGSFLHYEANIIKAGANPKTAPLTFKSPAEVFTGLQTSNTVNAVSAVVDSFQPKAKKLSVKIETDDSSISETIGFAVLNSKPDLSSWALEK